MNENIYDKDRSHTMYQEERKKTGVYVEHLGGGEEGDLIQRGREMMESLILELSSNTNTVA